MWYFIASKGLHYQGIRKRGDRKEVVISKALNRERYNLSEIETEVPKKIRNARSECALNMNRDKSLFRKYEVRTEHES